MTDQAPATEDDREPVLELRRNVSTHYGMVSVLRDVDMATTTPARWSASWAATPAARRRP